MIVIYYSAYVILGLSKASASVLISFVFWFHSPQIVFIVMIWSLYNLATTSVSHGHIRFLEEHMPEYFQVFTSCQFVCYIVEELWECQTLAVWLLWSCVQCWELIRPVDMWAERKQQCRQHWPVLLSSDELARTELQWKAFVFLIRAWLWSSRCG